VLPTNPIHSLLNSTIAQVELTGRLEACEKDAKAALDRCRADNDRDRAAAAEALAEEKKAGAGLRAELGQERSQRSEAEKSGTGLASDKRALEMTVRLMGQVHYRLKSRSFNCGNLIRVPLY